MWIPLNTSAPSSIFGEIMADKPWKVHERKVARYFGVERNLRGDDFSRKNCDVIAPLTSWEKVTEAKVNNTPGDVECIVVECKYRADLGLHKLMSEVGSNSTYTEKVPIAVWGEYFMCWLTNPITKQRDFDTAWVNLITNYPGYLWLCKVFHVETLRRMVPSYIQEYIEQAYDYALDNRKKNGYGAFPVAAIRCSNKRGAIAVWKMDFICDPNVVGDKNA